MDKIQDQTTYPRRRIGWLANSVMGGLMGSSAVPLALALFLGSQGTAAIPLLMVGIFLAWMVGPGYLELVMMYPDKVGGIGAVCYDAFRPYNPIIANIAGTGYVIGWITGSSFGALLISTIIQQVFFPAISIYWLSTFLILGITLLSLCGLYWITRLAIPAAAIAIVLTVLSCLIPILTGHVNWHQAFSFHLKSPFPGAFGQLTGLMTGMYLISWIAPAVSEGVLCFVGETKQPQKNIPRAMFISLSIGIIYYILCPVIWLGTFGIDTLLKDQLGIELPTAYAPLFNGFAKMAGASFIIFNFFLWLLVPLANLPRNLAQLSKDGLLPRSFALETKRYVPWVATFFISAISILIIWAGTPNWLIASTNFSCMLAYFLVSVAVWLLRKNEPKATRLYRAPKGFVLIGLSIGVLWILTAIFGFQQYGLGTMILGIAFSFTGVILYLWRIVSDRKKEGLPLFANTLHLRLSGPMLTVLILDAMGYLIAVNSLPVNTPLVVMLEDIFVVIALFTISIGIILPGIIVKTAEQLNITNKRLKKEFSEHKQTTERLAELNKQMIIAARRAGMADIATSVLHNIGNILNSINISVSMIEEKLVHSEMIQLNKLADLLEHNKANLEMFLINDPQGKHVPAYLLALASIWNTEEKYILDEVKILSKGTEHIRNIISMQQSLSGIIGMSEVTSIEELIQDALAFNRIISEKEEKIKIIRDFTLHKPVCIDRIKLLLVLVNLIKNSIESLLESKNENKQLVIQLKEQDDMNFIIQISDNGVGILPENISKIFSYGFTTKKTGHGFGLHTSHLSAKEMGGELLVSHARLDKGATFTLILPYQSQKYNFKS